MHDDDTREATGAGPGAPGVGRGIERSGILQPRKPMALAPRRDFGRTRHDDDIARSGRGDHGIGHALRECDPSVVLEDAGEARLPEPEGAKRDDDPRRGGGGVRGVVLRGLPAHDVRMLPAVDALYSGAKGLFYPGLRYGLRWTIEGEDRIPRHGP